MLITQKSSNLTSSPPHNKTIDWLELEWYETNKRILHKRTRSGRELTLKFLKENQNLTQGDILFEDDNTIIAVEIISCAAIIISPKNMFEMASICYEIGNKHLPLFYQDEEILVPFDAPLFRMLKASYHMIEQGERKLLNPLRTSVHPHGSGSSLFSKIMQLTNPS